MKKNVFFSIGTLTAGGAERVISILSNELVEEGYDVTIMYWLDLPVFYSINHKVKLVNITRECDSDNILCKALYFRRYIQRQKPDLFLSFLAIFNILTLVSLIGVKVKKVVCERNDPRFTPLQKPLRKVRNWIYNLADGILVQTLNNKEYFSKVLQKKVEVIYNPIFMEDSVVGSALKIQKEKLVVSVARLSSQKNQDMLIEAFADFYKLHPDYRMVIYGNGNRREALQQKIEDEGLKHCVSLPGVKKNIFEFIKLAEFFVLSSNFEGMPNTLLEAMCLGLPCISTKVSGAVDFIKDGDNGLLVEIGSKSQMTHAMCLLADDEVLRTHLGDMASNLYKQLNVRLVIKQWEKYIDGQISK